MKVVKACLIFAAVLLSIALVANDSTKLNQAQQAFIDLKLDTAEALLSSMEQPNQKARLLLRLVNDDALAPNELRTLLVHVFNQEVHFRPAFIDYLKTTLAHASFDQSTPNYDYLFCAWLMTTTATNEGYLDLSSELFFEAQEYLEGFDPTNPIAIRGNALLQAHQGTIHFA